MYSQEACNELEKQGVPVRLLDMHTIKPLDEEAVKKAMKDTKGIITVEDHNKYKGLGSAVAENDGSCHFKRIAIQDHFGESAPYESLLAKNGITAENIVKIAKKML